MPERRWTNPDLANYISRFNANQRDLVMAELIESERLKAILDKPEGQMIIDAVTDTVTDQTRRIVRLSIDGFEKNHDEIHQAALEIDVAYRLMHKLAEIATRGEKHCQELERK